MKDLGLLPPLGSLFNLGFLGQNASTAYTVSGAFVGWIHDRYGAAALRAWYGGRPLDEVTGVPFATLESTWKGELDAITLPDAARAQAKARFDRPAIFGRKCPRIVDACKSAGDRLPRQRRRGGARAPSTKRCCASIRTMDRRRSPSRGA